METKELIENGESYLLHTYNRQPVVFDKGEGVYLYDTEGKKYLDFASGIGVMGLGYSNEEYKDALKKQIDKLTHTSNLFYNEPAVIAAEKIAKASQLERTFFTNSGTEAIEGAIKAARKYAYVKDGSNDHEIIAMNHSFHGRSYGSLSVTGNSHYQEAFKPMIGGVKFADFNNLEMVKSLVNEKTCAIILEPIQGEGGVHPATQEFMDGIKKICTDNDILLIFDEIQCGMGRTGNMFAWQGYGVKPDIMTLAKSFGCGVPVGAFVMSQKVADVTLKPGDHGTTYGGNPLVCTAVNKVFDIYEKEKILEHVNEIAPYFESALNEIAKKCKCVEGVRGKGLMQGLVVYSPTSEIISKAMNKGLIILSAGSNVIRMLPPLVIEKEHIDKMKEIMLSVLS